MKWIKCSEQMPEDGHSGYVYDGNEIKYAKYHMSYAYNLVNVINKVRTESKEIMPAGFTEMGMCCDDMGTVEHVTHWMSLPEVPNE